MNSYVALSRTVEGGDEAGRVALGWRDRIWDASAQVRQVGEEFAPEMGFVRRRGIRQWYATIGAHPRPPVAGLLEVNPYGEADVITDLDGTRLSWTGTMGFAASFRDGGTLALQYDDRRERLVEPFVVRAEATAPVGDYHFREGSISYRSSEGRSLAGSVTVSGGGFFGGSRLSANGSLSWQPDYHLTLEASATHNALSVQNRDFSADLYTLRVKYAYSTSLYFGVFVQYNADVDEVATNARVRFIHAPLTDLFLVFTERRDVAAGTVLERGMTAKFTKLFAL